MFFLDPLVAGVEVWLVIFGSLPYAIRSLMNLSFGMFMVISLFKLFYNIRS